MALQALTGVVDIYFSQCRAGRKIGSQVQISGDDVNLRRLKVRIGQAYDSGPLLWNPWSASAASWATADAYFFSSRLVGGIVIIEL